LQYMDLILPPAWRGLAEVEWHPGMGGKQSPPSRHWLACFWTEVLFSDPEMVAMFSAWPLIPTCSGTLVSCSRLRQVLHVWEGSLDVETQEALRVAQAESMNLWEVAFSARLLSGTAGGSVGDVVSEDSQAQSGTSAGPSSTAAVTSSAAIQGGAGGGSSTAALPTPPLASTPPPAPQPTHDADGFPRVTKPSPSSLSITTPGLLVSDELSAHQLHSILVRVGVPVLQPAFFRGPARPVVIAPERLPPAVLASLSDVTALGRAQWQAVGVETRTQLLRFFRSYSVRERGGVVDVPFCVGVENVV
jgi:hypothetical protein